MDLGVPAKKGKAAAKGTTNVGGEVDGGCETAIMKRIGGGDGGQAGFALKNNISLILVG